MLRDAERMSEAGKITVPIKGILLIRDCISIRDRTTNVDRYRYVVPLNLSVCFGLYRDCERCPRIFYRQVIKTNFKYTQKFDLLRLLKYLLIQSFRN